MYKYKRVSEESLLEHKQDVEEPQSYIPQGQSRLRNYHILLWTAQIVFFLSSCVFFLSGLRLRHGASTQCHDRDFLPQWSPVLDAVKDSGHFHRFDGSFATPNEYKGTPSPLIDAAWDRALMASGKLKSPRYLMITLF